MTVERWAAFCLIGAFVAIAASTVANAPGLYATKDIEDRLRIVEANRTRWLVNEVFVFVFGILTIAGFALLATAIHTDGQDWIPALAAAAIVVGTGSGMYFAYLQITDPRGAYSGKYPIPENLAYWLWLAAMALCGAAFLLSDFPDWLGYATAAVSAAYAVAFLITGAGFMTTFILALFSLVAAITLLGR
jgi:hypothetical protein